jgi:four helix bundle protein
MREFMNYVSWLKSVPQEITGDPLWKVEAYRLAMFLADLGWHDATKLTHDKRMLGLADQLCRALGSIAANVSEGYSRGSGKDRARFYEYALGSARESRTWYYGGRHVLGEKVTEHRMCLVTQIIRLLLTMVPDQRNNSLKEDSTPYRVASEIKAVSGYDELPDLLKNAPLPEFTHHASRITSPDDPHAP